MTNMVPKKQQTQNRSNLDISTEKLEKILEKLDYDSIPDLKEQLKAL